MTPARGDGPGRRPSGLPIDEALPALRDALARHPAAVLQAPPGAGKSTVVPLALLDEPWMSGRKLLMLEPRRLAARAVAQRMAATLGERVGETVGYRMRLDTRVSRATRIEVVTEGVLTRMLQSDPALEGVALVVFDEFHERSLQADLGLALVLDARDTLAPELRLLVMSATLDGAPIARLLGEAPIVTTAGRTFPVETRFIGRGAPLLQDDIPRGSRSGVAMTLERVVANAVRRALDEEHGDVLVFLPGAREIRQVQALLRSSSGDDPGGVMGRVRVLPLFGELSREEQDAALEPASSHRKVVLATNIAETSLTIDGVRIVVDCGLVRRSLFDPATGLDRLETQRISRASADQRRGRAGRTEPGVCYRLWSEEAHRTLAAFTPAEIQSSDLTPLALELAGWGVADPAALRWLDPPREASHAAARALLDRLGALDDRGRITAHGREMAKLGVHPRLAHMLLRGREWRAGLLASELAALLSERDLLRTGGDADVRSRLDRLRGELDATGRSDHAQVDSGALQRARRAIRLLVRQLGAEGDRDAGDRESASVGRLLALAYPDRIGRRRGATGCYTLANGRGACFAGPQSLARQTFIVALDLDDADRDARIRLAAPLAREEIDALFADRIVTADSVEWSSREEAVIARRVTRLDNLVLDEEALEAIPADAATSAMLAGIRELGIAALPWTRDARDLQARIEFARLSDPDGGWPAVDDPALLMTLETWLAPWLEGASRRSHLARIALVDALRALLPWDQQRRLDDLAPAHLTVPTGSRIRIDYIDEHAPSIAVRMQEVFGLEATPRIGGGRVPVTLKLLSPAQRPLQITRDLASFWRGAYADVRKDMRGRYPRHYWPENPLEAEPTRRAKPRGS